MQLSKKRLSELCATCTFADLMTKLNEENNTTLPVSTIKKLLKENGLNCLKSRLTISIVDDMDDVPVSPIAREVSESVETPNRFA